MNILITTPYPMWPVNFGGAARTFNIALSLAKIGHKVTLLSPEPITQQYCNQFKWCSYKGAGVVGHFWNLSFYNKLELVLKDEFDLVLMEFPYQAFMVIHQTQKKKIPVIYDAHNVEKDRFLSMGSRLKSFLVGLTERHLSKKAKAILAVSDEDIYTFQSRYKLPIKLLPNGVDLEKFVFADANRQLLSKYSLSNRKVVLYFGAFNYPPNLEALQYLTKEIWPKVTNAIHNASLLVVGKNPPLWLHSSEDIVVTGLVDDIVAHIQVAQVVAVPLFTGGGSRLKIIEALACGKTVLSTKLGAAGFIKKQGAGLVLTSEDSFADELIHLLKLENGSANTSSRIIANDFSWLKLVEEINWNKIVE